ncbi:zinc finger domain-containing protein [Streptomyces sp. NPDC055036]
MTDPQHLPQTSRSDADDVEAHACPKCEAQPGSPCRTSARPMLRITRAIRLWLTRAPSSRSSAVILGTP